MSEIKVKSGRAEDATVITVNFELPTSTSDAVAKFGEEITTDLINRALTLGVQALVRTKMRDEGFDQAKAQAAVDSWVPGVRGPITRQTPLERATSALSKLDGAALAELLAKVKAAQKAAA